MENLTKRQKDILEFIKKYTAKYDYSPTIREICQGVNLSSPATVFVHIKNLEKNGYIGGATILNGSNVVGTGSKVSKEIFGKEAKQDSPVKLVRDITRECCGTNYPMLSNLLANNIGRAVDFIADFANFMAFEVIPTL